MCWRARRYHSSILVSLRLFSILVLRARAAVLLGSSCKISWTFCKASGYSSCSKRVGAFAGAGETMPGLLGHGLVDHAADGLAHRRVQVGGGRRNVVQDGPRDFARGGALEGPAAREGLVTDDAQREDVRQGGVLLQLD